MEGGQKDQLDNSDPQQNLPSLGPGLPSVEHLWQLAEVLQAFRCSMGWDAPGDTEGHSKGKENTVWATHLLLPAG